MASLARSKRKYTGALVHIAIEVASTSDADTKPASDNAAWLQAGSVQSLAHFPLELVEEYSEPDAQLGWRDRKEDHNTGDRYEITLLETSDLFERLSKALESAIVEDTAQTPGVAGSRMLRAWVKIQCRKSDGTDDSVEDLWCEIRPMAPPAVTKGTQQIGFELWVLENSLNAIDYPAAS